MGLIAREITRRMHGFGQAGGGRGTGFEPSPRDQTSWKVIERKAGRLGWQRIRRLEEFQVLTDNEPSSTPPDAAAACLPGN
jgi:hypothetical protein